MSDVIAVKLQSNEKVVLALRPEQAAESIGVSVVFLKSAIQRGDIKTVRKGRGYKKVVLVPVASLVDYLNSGNDPTDEKPGDDADEE